MPMADKVPVQIRALIPAEDKVHVGRMKQIISILVFLVATNSWIYAEEASTVLVNETGSKKVDALVAQLVSRDPPPHAAGTVSRSASQQLISGLKNDIWATEEVRNAMAKLNAEGPPAFFYLVQHLKDERYSYSAFYPTDPPNFLWHNRKVSEAVIDILANGLNRMQIYKSRISPTGLICTQPTFQQYMDAEGTALVWAQKVASNSRSQVDRAFIDWCIEREKSWGFETPEEQRDILGQYNLKRGEAAQDGTGQPATSPESDSEDGDKPQPEAEGRSR